MADDQELAEVDPSSPGINRRSLIKKAAIAGGAAWSAPVILGSIASPAAAVSANGCFEMWSILGPVTGTWTDWIEGTIPLLNCHALDACPGAQPAPADMRAETGPPTPVPPNDNVLPVPVTVTAPPGCRIAGAGVYFKVTTDSGLTCVRTSTGIAAPNVDIDIPLGRASVTITTHGLAGGMSGFWDNEGGLRSSIWITLICP